MNYFVVNGQMV